MTQDRSIHTVSSTWILQAFPVAFPPSLSSVAVCAVFIMALFNNLFLGWTFFVLGGVGQREREQFQFQGYFSVTDVGFFIVTASDVFKERLLTLTQFYEIVSSRLIPTFLILRTVCLCDHEDRGKCNIF